MGLLRRYGVLFLALLFCAQAAAGLRILTEPGPPTAFMKDGELQGFGVDVVRELITRTGSQAQIEMMPWTRAYTIAQREPGVALFAMMRTPDREKRFQWAGPILHGKVRFYSLKSSGLKVDSLQDVAASGPLAVPKQWYSYEVLKDQGLQNLYGVPTPETMVTMFRHGRVSLIMLEDILLRDMLAPAGLTPADVEPQMVFMESSYYIAFSLDTDQAVVAAWQSELAEMRRDGSFSAIFRQWLPDVELPEALR
ncbi:transporter substrate-binding domain-containing protein [Pseudomonas sp. MM211]|uniref:substrate-binding periplasmic protein n=1 Tax=Pseudomonas sp. MM211 TaxID=2866808 RepID=UPI001CEC9892|nr:transporter substrate-binding domain-containing protein [Pseudomonas sp. MM211]UCJ17222.1 transporter substrate-binding domain-containing protein [Pseudomonas sp. MM211]